MKNKHLQYLIFLILLTVTLDHVVGRIYDELYFSEKSIKNDRLIHSAIRTNEDILIFGSSRALHHYNPEIIMDSLEMNCYNVGSGGQNIYYHLAILKSALERYTPKIAILELMTIDFEQTPKQHNTEKLGALAPFTNKSVAAKEALLLRGYSEELKLKSAIYPFNSLQYKTFRNIFFPFQNSKYGYMPINRVYSGELKEKAIQGKKNDNSKVKALDLFIQTCEENSIKLFIFVSPNYSIQKDQGAYFNISNRLKTKFDIKVNNFESNNTFMENPKYFADPFHLNEEGADFYTSNFVVEILKVK